MFTATKEQIEAWKKEHGDVFGIRVEDKRCYLKKPGRKVLSYANQAGKKDAFVFNEIIIKNCWLDGDKEIQDVEAYFLGACPQLKEIVAFKESELEKY